jgi:hypothetical protein
VNGTCEFQLVEGACLTKPEPKPDDPRAELFCPRHCNFEWRVCVGCSGSAMRECGHDDPASPGVCRSPVCNLCRHEGQHHTQEAPADPLNAPVGQSARDALRADLEASIRASIVHAGEHQIPLDTTVAMILDNLLLHVGFQVLSGMAANPPQ